MMRVIQTEMHQLEPENWDDLLSNSEVCDAFQTIEWAQVQRKSAGVQSGFLMVRSGGQIIGGVMFFLRKMFGVLDSYEVRGGPLYVKGNKEIVMRSILKALSKRKHKAVNLLFVPSPVINASLEQAFKSEGFSYYPFRTIIIDTGRKLENIWKGLDKKARWGVRKAERLGLNVREATTWQEWEQFYILHLLHGKEKQYPTEPLQFFREMFKLRDRKMARLFLVEYEKQAIAGSLFLIYKKNMVFLQNASKAAFLPHNPNNLLQWKSIEWAKENGVITYDMNGLPTEEVPYLRGVYNFKKQWDGQIHSQYYYMSRKLLYTAMHLVRTNSFAWRLFLSARNLQAV